MLSVLHSILLSKMGKKDMRLHKIWLVVSEAPGFNSFNVKYTVLSSHLGTPAAILEDLKDQFSRGELFVEQVLYHLIKDWFFRTENANLDKLLMLLSKAGWYEIVDYSASKRQSTSTQKSRSAITFDSSQSIGNGKFGTIVYKGLWKGRNVAVKKIICGNIQHDKLFFNQAKALIKYDGHENIVKYYNVEEISGAYPVFLIALELCDITLERWVKNPDCLEFKIDTKDVLGGTTRGLEYLHQNKIIHMNIKPGNIMLVGLRENCIKVKLCDFGITCKKISTGTSEVISSDSESFCCIAPEVLQAFQEHPQLRNDKITTSSDIFSLGCVFHYVLFKGKHPFGDDLVSIQTNILNYKPQVRLKVGNGFEAGYIRLLLMMIAKNPLERPPAAALLKHHIFWSNVKTLHYLVAVRNSFESIIEGTTIDNCVYEINNDPLLLPYCEPFDSDGWIRFLCPEIQTHVQDNGTRRVRYQGDLVSDLIRLIRNMQNHYTTLPVSVRDRVGTLLEQFLEYWVERFPLLIDSVFMVFEKVKNDPASGLREYYATEYMFNDMGISELNTTFLLRFVNLECARRLLNCFKKERRIINKYIY